MYGQLIVHAEAGSESLLILCPSKHERSSWQSTKSVIICEEIVAFTTLFAVFLPNSSKLEDQKDGILPENRHFCHAFIVFLLCGEFYLSPSGT